MRETALSIFKDIGDLKVRVALDNFGAGLASMNHFIRLPIDLVKVDRRLIAYLPIPGKQSSILRTIFDLGRTLEVSMLAEGIERKEQLEALQLYGCDLGPGASVFAAGVAGKGAGAPADRPLVDLGNSSPGLMDATMTPCHADALL